MRELEMTIARVLYEIVVGTPIDLTRLVTIHQPVVRVRYELQEIGRPDLTDALTGFLERLPHDATEIGSASTTAS